MIGYVVGLCFSYVVNGIFTFKAKRFGLDGFLRFLLVFCFAYAANLLVTMLVINSGLVNAYLGHVVGVLPYTVLSFLGGKFFVFRGVKNVETVDREAA